MDGGAWQTSLWGGNVSDTTEWLSTQHTHTSLTPPTRDWPLFLSPFSFEVAKKKKKKRLFPLFCPKVPFGHDVKPRGNFKNLILGYKVNLPNPVYCFCGINVYGNNFNQIRVATMLDDPAGVNVPKLLYKTSTCENPLFNSRFSKHFKKAVKHDIE